MMLSGRRLAAGALLLTALAHTAAGQACTHGDFTHVDRDDTNICWTTADAAAAGAATEDSCGQWCTLSKTHGSGCDGAAANLCSSCRQITCPEGRVLDDGSYDDYNAEASELVCCTPVPTCAEFDCSGEEKRISLEPPPADITCTVSLPAGLVAEGECTAAECCTLPPISCANPQEQATDGVACGYADADKTVQNQCEDIEGGGFRCQCAVGYSIPQPHATDVYTENTAPQGCEEDKDCVAAYVPAVCEATCATRMWTISEPASGAGECPDPSTPFPEWVCEIGDGDCQEIDGSTDYCAAAVCVGDCDGAQDCAVCQDKPDDTPGTSAGYQCVCDVANGWHPKTESGDTTPVANAAVDCVQYQGCEQDYIGIDSGQTRCGADCADLVWTEIVPAQGPPSEVHQCTYLPNHVCEKGMGDCQEIDSCSDETPPSCGDHATCVDITDTVAGTAGNLESYTYNCECDPGWEQDTGIPYVSNSAANCVEFHNCAGEFQMQDTVDAETPATVCPATCGTMIFVVTQRKAGGGTECTVASAGGVEGQMKACVQGNGDCAEIDGCALLNANPESCTSSLACPSDDDTTDRESCTAVDGCIFTAVGSTSPATDASCMPADQCSIGDDGSCTSTSTEAPAICVDKGGDPTSVDGQNCAAVTDLDDSTACDAVLTALTTDDDSLQACDYTPAVVLVDCTLVGAAAAVPAVSSCGAPSCPAPDGHAETCEAVTGCVYDGLSCGDNAHCSDLDDTVPGEDGGYECMCNVGFASTEPEAVNAEKAGCTWVPEKAVKALVTLDMDIATIPVGSTERETFEVAFRTQMAELLSVVVERIEIISVEPPTGGGVTTVVNFYVLPGGSEESGYVAYDPAAFALAAETMEQGNTEIAGHKAMGLSNLDDPFFNPFGRIVAVASGGSMVERVILVVCLLIFVVVVYICYGWCLNFMSKLEKGALGDPEGDDDSEEEDSALEKLTTSYAATGAAADESTEATEDTPLTTEGGGAAPSNV